MKAIGIDIGTTSICGVIIDCKSGKIEASVTKNSNAFIETSASWEKIQSVDKIITVATEILESFSKIDVVAIGLTGQMHGIVYTDENGCAVSPLYTWQDERGNLPYKDTTYAKYLGTFTGYGNVTDFYNRVNGIRPENAVSYCTIHDYFAMKLCGLKTPVIHSTDAASFGMYDIDKNSFNYDFCPDITSGYTIIGKYKNIPVAAAIGDNQASVFSTLVDENAVLVNIGTGSQISVIADKPGNSENIETRPYFESKYLLVGAALCGGRAYSILKDFFKEIVSEFIDVDDNKVYEVMNRFALKKHTSLKIDSRFAGTRRNSELRGNISNISTENLTAENLTIAMLDAMATELYDMYEETGLKRLGLIGSGNGIRKNDALIKILENKFGAVMNIPEHTEEAAFGAALYSLVSAGIFKDAQDAHSLVKYWRK